MDGPKPDWNISQLYEKAWHVVKNNKVLWVFGASLGGLSFSGGNNYTSGFTSHDFDKLQQFLNNSSSQADSTSVLGATASSLGQTLATIFSAVPPIIYVLFGIEVVVLIIFFIVYGLVNSAWTEGALLQSVNTALTGAKPTIADSSQKSFPSIKPLIWLDIVPTLIFMLISAAVFLAIITGLSATAGVLKAIFILGLIVAIGAFIYWILILSTTLIWASRKAVLDGKSGRESFFQGYKIIKHKFLGTILLGLVNTILTWIIVGVVLVTIGGILLGGVFSLKFDQSVGVTLLSIGGLLVLVFILASQLLSGLLIAFKATVWNQAYLNIKGKYEHD